MDTCTQCARALHNISEVHTLEGQLFCSKECAINYIIDDITLNAKGQAIEEYNDKAEVVTPEEIGLVYKKVWTAYDSNMDVTTVFESRYLDEEMTETINTKLLGFYWGKPNDEDTEKYKGTFEMTY